MVVLRQPGQHQLGFSAAPFEIDNGRQLDRAAAWLSRVERLKQPATEPKGPNSDPVAVAPTVLSNNAR
jgi:hypothetical protein